MYEELNGTDTVKEKLIIAGINELQNHGMTDFSLRRVASECGISCAAPYKHFKDKDNFIKEIVAYIDRSFEMLASQVARIYAKDKKALLIETCIAYIRFWIANPNFRSVLMTSAISSSRIKAGERISETAKDYFAECGYSKDTVDGKIYRIRSLVYGATLMLDDGEISNDNDTMKMIRASIEEQL